MSLVERIARRMAEVDGLDPDAQVLRTSLPMSTTGLTILPDLKSQPWLVSYAWQVYVSKARAALAVAQEPTDDMVERGECVRGNHDDSWKEGNGTRSVYRAMIDTALEEI